MLEDNIMNLTFASSLTDVVEENSSFDRGVLRVAYEGDNQNKTAISHDAFERGLKTIANVPVVANYTVEDDRIGGHDVSVVKDDKGKFRLINMTEPLGIVPESGKQWFEEVEEDDGQVHNYLFTEVLLWKRQPVYSKIKRDGVTAHSMEITIKDGYKKDGIFHIDDFEFTAFCLLGDDVQPCFESSALEVFSASDFKQAFTEMMKELKTFAKQANSSNDDGNKHPQENLTEGGNDALNEKMELAAKYGIDVESLDFSIDDFDINELEEKFQSMTAGSVSEGGNGATDNADVPNDKASENFALSQNVIKGLCDALDTQKFNYPWGEGNRYFYVDSDFEKHEVYVNDASDWNLYGFAYTVDGDAVSVDFESKKRKKIEIVDFDEGGENIGTELVGAFELFTEVGEYVSNMKNELSEMTEKFNSMSSKVADAESELETLRNFKKDIEAAEAKEKRDSVFSSFEDLAGIEAFEALKENCDGMDADALRKECFAIRGEFGMKATFAANEQKAIKIKVAKETGDALPYGGIVEKYINKGI